MAAPASQLRRQRMLFAALWATAHLIHAWHQGGGGVDGRLEDLTLVPVLLAALAVLSKPSSSARLAILAGIQLLVYVIQMPLVANHWTIAAFVNAGILAAALVGRREARSSSRDLLRIVAPYARVVFLVSYTAAAVAKLNRTFLDPEHSCAVELLAVVTGGLEAPGPSWLAVASVVVTVGVELSIPAMLLWNRTRLLGIGLAGIFHLLLAVAPAVVVMDFSMFVFALMVVFAPSDIGVRFAEEVDRSTVGRRIRRLTGKPAQLVRAVGVVFVLLVSIGRGALLGGELWAVVSWGSFLLAGSVVVSMGLATLASYRRDPATSPPPAFHQRLGAVQLILIGLLVLNAGSPYLGGKTTSSFTMFSNLRTEGGVSNHLLLPRLAISSSQDDMVRIHASTNGSLQNHADKNELLAYHELRRTLRSDPSAAVDFTRRGKLHSLDAADQDLELTSLPLLPRKLLHFRPVNAAGPPICQA